ncbi:MAG: hypothetical protein Q9180_002109 [Flavoplaca navasiana]
MNSRLLSGPTLPLMAVFAAFEDADTGSYRVPSQKTTGFRHADGPVCMVSKLEWPQLASTSA